MRNGADMARQPEMADWIQQAVMAAGDLFYDWDLTTDNIVWAGQGSADLRRRPRTFEARREIPEAHQSRGYADCA